MERHETSEDIDRAAADWAARLDGCELSPGDQTTLDEWASADPRRFGALARAMAVLAHFDPQEQARPAFERRAPQGPLQRRPQAGVVRRRFLYGGAAAAAAVGVSLTGTVAYARRGQYHTGKGEVRSVPLGDGSVIWLNTDSVVKVRYGPTQRAVILARGEAMFEVAKDPSRPFVVHAGATSVRAVGTAFSVSHVSDRAVRVLVNEGLVDFADTEAAAPVRLRAGCNAVSGAPGGIAVVHVGVPIVGRALSWRRGQLDFDGVTLAEAARTFAKYSDEQIVIDDPKVARLTVSGLFSSTDPAGFAKAVALSMDLKARPAGAAIHLSR
jgi:transmembrane sensor